MSENNAFSNHKMTLFPVENEVCLLAPLENLFQVLKALSEVFSIDGEVVHEYFHDVLS